MAKNIYAGLKQLGKETAVPDSPEAATLERVANPHPGTDYLVRFTAPEFTSLCPITGQPDFAEDRQPARQGPVAQRGHDCEQHRQIGRRLADSNATDCIHEHILIEAGDTGMPMQHRQQHREPRRLKPD